MIQRLLSLRLDGVSVCRDYVGSTLQVPHEVPPSRSRMVKAVQCLVHPGELPTQVSQHVTRVRSRRGERPAWEIREKPYAVGSVFLQTQLAGTLKRIARHGVEDFYQGRIANLIRPF